MKIITILFASILASAPFAMAAPIQVAGEDGGAVAADVSTLRQGLADWRLDLELEVPSQRAPTALLELRAQASTFATTLPQDEQVEAQELLADCHVEVLIWWGRIGDSEALSAELMSLRLTAANSRVAVQLREAAKVALRRPTVVPLMQSLTVAQREAAISSANSASEDEVIAQAVREAMKNGDGQFLQSLGSRALPELERLALLEDGSPRPEGEFDPLRKMFQVDAARAMNTANRLVGQRPTLLVKRVVMDALRVGRVLLSPEIWTPDGEAGTRFSNPEWHDLFNRLVEEPAVDSAHMHDLLESLIERGVIPAGLESAALANGPVNVRADVVVMPGHRALAVRCLESESASIRANAVQKLAKTRDIREVLSLFEDPSSLVRESVAKCLGPRKIRVWASPLQDVVDRLEVLPPVAERAYQTVLAALVEDDSERVWTASLNSWAGVTHDLESPILPLDVCVRLVQSVPQDRLKEVTNLSGYWRKEGSKECFELATAAMNALSGTTWDSGRRSKYLLGLLQQLGANSEYRWRTLQRIPELGLSDEDTAQVLRTWANVDAEWDGLGEAYVSLLERLDSSLAWQAAIAMPSQASTSKRWAEGLADDLVERVWIGASMHRAAIDWTKVDYFPVTPEAAARAVQNPKIAPEVKLARLPEVRGQWGDRLTPEVLRALSEAAQQVEDSSFHFKAFDHLPDDRLQDYLIALLGVPDIVLAGGRTQPAIADAWLLSLSIPGMREETIAAVLDRFPPERFALPEFASSYHPRLLWSLIEAMIESGDAKYLSAIEAASTVPALQSTLVWAIGNSGRGDLFGLLTDVVRSVPQGQGTWRSGLAAVASFLDDRAMEFLLEHARQTSHASNREVVMAHLDEVKRWQEASAQWERSRRERNMQRDAIARLVKLLDDSTTPLEARAEALRGLGLLGAAEELPRLIKALTAPEAELQQAAREAIDRLHTPTK